MNARGICYDPVNQGIIIPHYDENGALIGIRSRTLIKEEEVYGKYRPAIINGKQYNHPLGFALYNLNNSKKAIAQLGTAIVFEGENIKLNTLYGMDISLKDQKYEAMLTSSNIGEKTFNEKGTTTLTASLFNFDIKDIEVNVLDKTTVIPVGKVAGIKLYTKGVLVVGMAEVQGIDKQKHKPYEKEIDKSSNVINLNGVKYIKAVYRSCTSQYE